MNVQIDKTRFAWVAVAMFTAGLMLVSCGPKGGGGRSTGAQTVKNGDGAVSTKDKDRQNQNEIRQTLLSELPDDPSIDQLNKLHVGELKLLAAERRNQNRAEIEQLELLAAMNMGLCRKLNSVRNDCPASARLVSSGFVRQLNCDGSYSKKSETDEQITITIPQQVSTPMMLIANDSYQSSKFSGGTTTIKFRSISSEEVQAPKFIQIYKLVIVPFNRGDKLPGRDQLPTEIKVGGKTLIQSQVYNSEDPKKLSDQTEYRLNVAQILNVRESSRCKVTMSTINTLKEQIKQTVTENQANKRTQDYMKGQQK